jgi:hypothetical protein
MTELPKEWHELAQRESVILNPNNSGNQEIYRLAHTDGATAYKQAVEKKLKENIESVEKQVAAMTDGFEITKMTIEAMGAAYKITLEQLQTLTPISND